MKIWQKTSFIFPTREKRADLRRNDVLTMYIPLHLMFDYLCLASLSRFCQLHHFFFLLDLSRTSFRLCPVLYKYLFRHRHLASDRRVLA